MLSHTCCGSEYERLPMKLKALNDQVIVITGASSGIGLVTARQAARRGARLVLAARSEESIRQLADEINSTGGQAAYVAADVASEDSVNRISTAALARFGRIDTWVNNAGVAIFGKIEDVSDEDHQKLFQTNFWGTVYGSLVALPYLKREGGALINVGSVVSDQAVPLQGMYSASKHAVKGFTDALRMELAEEGAPVSVTLIKPAAIDTPYPQHARNYLPLEPKHPAPVYAPEVVSESDSPLRHPSDARRFCRWRWKGHLAYRHLRPRTADKWMEKNMVRQQKTDQPPFPNAHRGLYAPSGDLQERGRSPHHVAESSLYNKASLNPWPTAAVVAVGAAVTAAALLGPRGK